MGVTAQALITDLRLKLADSGTLIGPDQQEPPRFSLFHAPNSICSQKARVVLAHHQISYKSFSMSIPAGQTYLPDYVRLRLLGCRHSGLPLVNAHSGSTSVSAGGCDPAVVPTLVDHLTDQVIIDSKTICLYLDALVPELKRLSPLSQQQAIDAELEIVDNLPNYQMMAGRPAGCDPRPQSLQQMNGVNFALSKVKRCEQYIAEYAGDTELVRAYQAKRSKELDAADTLFSEEAVEAAYAKARASCAQLNEKLALRRGTNWLMGPSITLADLFWAVELLRMKNLGAAHIWEQDKLPAVEMFVAAAGDLASIRSAVLDWPGALL